MPKILKATEPNPVILRKVSRTWVISPSKAQIRHLGWDYGEEVHIQVKHDRLVIYKRD
jgi:hypothetical protein